MAEKRLGHFSQQEAWFCSQIFHVIDQLWLQPRPVMALNNSQQSEVAIHLLSEIDETASEHAFEGVSLSAKDLQKELIDIFVLVTSFLKNAQHNNELHLAEIAYYNHQELLNLAKASNVYERLKELVSEIAESNQLQAITEFKALLFSLTMNLPVQFAPREILQTVLLKNEQNYPKEYFQIYDPIIKRTLSELELFQKYAHVKKALRLLRDANLINQHQHFAFLIHDFQVSEASLKRLAVEIKNCTLPRINNGLGEHFVMNPGEEYQVSRTESGVVIAKK